MAGTILFESYDPGGFDSFKHGTTDPDFSDDDLNRTINKTVVAISPNISLSDVGESNVEPVLDFVVVFLTSVILGLMILTTIIGNIFVIAAIVVDRHLQIVANYLILSLAVADLLVAILVMPLGAANSISKKWTMGPTLCDMWTSSDVLCCTASILHLLAIAIDRYWAVTQPHYIHSRNSTTIFILIGLVWLMSVVVSLAPLFGWKDDTWLDRVNNQQFCIVSQEISYQIFATSVTFFVPLFFILLLYWRIFVTARTRLRNRTAQKAKIPQPSGIVSTKTLSMTDNGKTETTTFSTSIKTMVASANGAGQAVKVQICEPSPGRSSSGEEDSALGQEQDSGERKHINKCPRHGSCDTTPLTNCGSQTDQVPPLPNNNHRPKRKKEKKHVSLEAKREKKAAKTLAIVTGAFILCWLPFFIIALIMPVCNGCIDNYVFEFFLWLGYFNSTLNPIIYTVFSPEFRQAFKKILCGKTNASTYRPRHLQ